MGNAAVGSAQRGQAVADFALPLQGTERHSSGEGTGGDLLIGVQEPCRSWWIHWILPRGSSDRARLAEFLRRGSRGSLRFSAISTISSKGDESAHCCQNRL